MKIEINLKIVIVLILLFLFNNINTYLIFLLFILIHEIAHLIIGIGIGGIPQKMTLSVFGVSIEFYSYEKNKTINKIIFFLIGPLINLIIAIIGYKFSKNTEIQKIIVVTNFSIGIFNLLPILPLDGGKILKEILNFFYDFEKSSIIIFFIGKLCLIIITLIYSVLIIKIQNIMILLLIIYLWYLFYIEKKKYYLYLKTKKAIESII